MYNYPIHFALSATAIPGVQENWTTTAEADPDQPVLLAIPEAFSGPGGALSPEELYGMAILNCFIATFKVIAEASKFTFETVDATMDLIVDKNQAGKPWVASTAITVRLKAASDPAKAPRLVEKASENCLIMNSVTTVKTLTLELVD